MTIKFVKIFGERLSGTNYIHELIAKNFNVELLGDLHADPGGWKHGPPMFDTLNMTETLIIAVFRDVESWAKAFYTEPWHTSPQESFEAFVTKPLEYGGLMANAAPKLPAENFGVTLMQLRLHKINQLMSLIPKPSNSVFVHLNALKSGNDQMFLTCVHDHFALKPLHTEWQDIKTHVKFQTTQRERDTTYVNLTPKVEDEFASILQTAEEQFVRHLEHTLVFKTYLENSLTRCVIKNGSRDTSPLGLV